MRKMNIEQQIRQQDITVWTPWGPQTAPVRNRGALAVRRALRRLAELREKDKTEAGRQDRRLDA